MEQLVDVTELLVDHQSKDAHLGGAFVVQLKMARFFIFVASLKLIHPKSRAPLRKSPLNLDGLAKPMAYFEVNE